LLEELDRDHEASELAEMSASSCKIQLQETVEAEEIDEQRWSKLKGRSIVSGERLQERFGDTVSCRFCHSEHYGKRAIAKWTWFIMDNAMPK